MNIEKYLVIIKGEDKTEQILSYEPNKHLINVNFKNGKKTYKYARNDFKFYKDPIEIDITNNTLIINNTYVYNVEKVIKFNDYYRIFFERNISEVFPEYQVELIKKEDKRAVSTNKFEYFKEISKIESIKTEEGVLLLTNEYKKINFISRDTALYKYLNPAQGLNTTNTRLETIIFPFGANQSQYEAVRKAMNNQISIIEGPPGTGKTQTILNIIANIVKNGQTAAVVSNNNAATNNVYEKLKSYNLDYLCATLGKKENREEFINNQTGKYPEFSKPLKDRDLYEKGIENLNNDINKIFELQNNIAKLKEELNQIKVEHNYFNKQESKELLNIPKIRNINQISSDIIMKLKIECEDFEIKNQNIDIWFKLKSWLLYGIGNMEFYKNSLKDLISYYNKIYFIVKEIEIDNKIKKYNKEIKMLGNNDKLELLKTNSNKLINEYLRVKYHRENKRKIFEIQDLYRNAEEFNKEYPIILSTTHSIKSCLNSNYKFDYIIMDEASQVDLITGVLALSSAKNAVIVGDLKQLPNVISADDRKQLEELSKKYEIEYSYNYLNHSFLSSIAQSIKTAPRTLLKEHYRCHPKIIGFCNKKFYNNELIIMTEDKGEKDVLKVYVTNEGNHARGHLNQRQIDVIQKEVMPELTKRISENDIGVISPYRKQKDELEKTLENYSQVDTVHKFQGREKDAIVITTVDNEISEFVDNPKMLNVAITRAKKYLRLVVSNSKENRGTNIDDLIKYIQYNNFEIIESKVKSIYDLLYKENRKKRMEYLKNKKRISEYDSENITYNSISEIIKKNNYDNLDVAVHIPLKHILKDMEQLNDEELKYASNIWTHIDLIIYNKMDKKLILAIEVDGYCYHKEGTKQQERDKLKEKILEKYDIPLIRLSTIGSGEEKIVENGIREAMKI